MTDAFVSVDDIVLSFQSLLEEFVEHASNSHMNNYVRPHTVSLSDQGETVTFEVSKPDDGLEFPLQVAIQYSIPWDSLDANPETVSSCYAEKLIDSDGLSNLKRAITQFFEPSGDVRLLASNKTQNSLVFSTHPSLEDPRKIPTKDGFSLRRSVSITVEDEWVYAKNDDTLEKHMSGDILLTEREEPGVEDYDFGDTVTVLGNEYTVEVSDEIGIELKDGDEVVASFPSIDKIKPLLGT